jgi:hypothetical protein
MSMPDNWAIHDKEALGVGTFRAATTFYKVDVTEVSGSGTPMRK